jgi:uncharacterized membrane protein YozB (DUF420 family)
VALIELRGQNVTPSSENRADLFFLYAAGAMLLVAVVGFSPTLILRFLFDVPELPARLYAHGAVFLAWFILFFSQAILIRHGSFETHKKIGTGVASLAVLVPITGVMAVFGAPARLAPSVGEIDPETLRALTGLAIGNISSLIFFVMAVSAGVICRRQAMAHKRFMLWASLFLLGPAFGRISRWPAFDSVQEPLFINLAMLGAVIIFFAHDFWSRRRPHWATVSCFAAAFFGGGPVVGRIVASDAAQAWVRSLL